MLDHFVVRPVSRSAWLGGRLLVALVVLVLSGIAAGVLGWLGAASQHTGLSFTSLLGAGVNLVPPAIVILGIGVLTFGIRPRATSIVVYAVLGWSLLIVIVGGFGTLSHWVLDTSVFHHMASAPGVPPNWEANGIMTAIGVAAALVGGAGLQATGPAGSMTTERATPSAPAGLPINERSVAFEDLTARARIREAALEHFARDGYDRATIRAIAKTAGVSPGLLRHHYGSKEALREACDHYVFEMLHRATLSSWRIPARRHRAQQTSKPFGHYVARSLADGSPTVGPIFDEMVTMTEQWLARADDSRTDTPTVDRRIRAALVTAMKIGIPLLHDHVSRVLGTDMFGPEGDRLVALALLDIYSHALIDDDVATSAAAGYEEPKR